MIWPSMNSFSNSFSDGTDTYPVNMIVSYFKLQTAYDNTASCLIIRKNERKVVIFLDSQYVLVGDKKIFINDFVVSDEGQYFLPTDIALLVMRYFSSDKYDYYIKNNEIFFTENNATRKTDDKDIEGKNIESKNIEDTKDDVETNAVNNQAARKSDSSKDTAISGNKKINVIIIDPGHGGKDPGAVGYNDIKEKDIVLKCALLLSEKLKQEFPGVKVVMTRDKDEFIELDERSKLANKMYEKFGNALFISIHVNASRSQKTYGFETWYLVNNYSRDIVKKGTVSDDKSVENVVNSLLNEEIYKESKDLAKKIQDRLENQVGSVSKNRSIKEEVYFVIKKSIMPAVLVEIGFNTNKYEAIRLTKYSYLNKITDGILEGIRDFSDVFQKTQGFTR
jgi:N-acetylmuramoyl-L-alanine amidase